MEVITKINREKGFNYRVDKNGNVIKENYNWFKDPYTLVAIVIIILGSLYYLQMQQFKTNEANFEEACIMYIELRDRWISQNPGQIPTLKEIMSIQGNEINQRGG